MKKLIAYYVSLAVVIVTSASLALKVRNNHITYTRNLVNGLYDIPVPGKAISNTTTSGLLANI